jgi:hypothetical protein
MRDGAIAVIFVVVLLIAGFTFCAAVAYVRRLRRAERAPLVSQQQ